jgi:hypothetical protein
MAAKGGESRAGLVVFLVLFILLSITLGVTTYYGYDTANTAQANEKKAKDEGKAWENDSNWYKYVATTYRQYLGAPLPAGDDAAAYRKEYGSGSGAKDKGKAEEHKKLIETLDKNKKWDDTQKKPGESFQEEVDRLKKELADQKNATAKANEDKDKALAQAEANKREVDKAKADFQGELAKVRKANDEQVDGLRKGFEAQLKEIDNRGDKAPKEFEDLRKQMADLNKQNQKLTKDLADARKTIKERGYEVAVAAAKAEVDVSRINPDNLAKIASINPGGDMPYINLGSADNLKRQATFSIYGKGIDGKPLRDPKGKLEVIRITGPHMAQCRITELRDERRDPVLPGDFIYNPAWNPNLKQHVAIVGTIDLTGDKRDGTQEFIRTLQAQGIEVDAYMDMKTKKLMKPGGDGPGEITLRTDLLIVGDNPEFNPNIIKPKDPKEAKKDPMQEVQDEAERKGVRVMSLHTFLEMSGYPLPRSLGSDRDDRIKFHKNLDSVGSPVQRREPPK